MQVAPRYKLLTLFPLLNCLHCFTDHNTYTAYILHFIHCLHRSDYYTVNSSGAKRLLCILHTYVYNMAILRNGLLSKMLD